MEIKIYDKMTYKLLPTRTIAVILGDKITDEITNIKFNQLSDLAQQIVKGQKIGEKRIIDKRIIERIK